MSNVLLIEDDQTMISLLTTLLELEGFSVCISSGCTPEDIPQTLLKDQPDIVLLDVHLRKANGFDILSRLRRETGQNHIKIVMTSGMDLHSQCISKGADAFLLKPYMPAELVQVIRQNLPVSG
ncbi:MAG: response regulator [Chloroflexi bacterium]|nr:response regulator [Chloroflexota bacterium]